MPLIATLAIGLAGGVLISNYTILGEKLDFNSISNQKAEKEILYWVAPMDPTYRRDEPGKSPMGMDLVPVYAGRKERTGNPLLGRTHGSRLIAVMNLASRRWAWTWFRYTQKQVRIVMPCT